MGALPPPYPSSADKLVLLAGDINQAIRLLVPGATRADINTAGKNTLKAARCLKEVRDEVKSQEGNTAREDTGKLEAAIDAHTQSIRRLAVVLERYRYDSSKLRELRQLLA